MGLASMLALTLGQSLERKRNGPRVLAQCIMAFGMGAFYATIFASCYGGSLRLFTNPLDAGLILLLWSLYVLCVADRRKSEPLALFAITLAYVGTALNSVTAFSLLADIILATSSAVFLIRSGWVALPTFALIGTYLAMLRRLVIDENGDLVLDTSRTLPFWPHAIYLSTAWFIFTLAIIITAVPTFRGLKRFVFLSLNNAALAFLLALTAYIAGYGASAIGWTLLDTGFVFLIASRFAGFAEIDPVDVMGAYAAQGLALFTAGIIIIFTGLGRAFALLIETFLLGVAGAFAGDRILTISTYVAAFFATVFCVWEIAIEAHHPWLLGLGGALIMFINAWACRGEVRHSTVARSTIVVSTTCFCIFAIALIFTALYAKLNDPTLPPILAIAALTLTFAIYQVSIFELPALAQVLMIAAQLLVIFPAETGEALPWWSSAWVAAITLILVTWWSRQRTIRAGSWKTPLTFVYAFALVDLTVQAVHPYFGAQGWMVVASFLSVAFLVYGALTRTWAVAAAGQSLLALALYHFFFPPQSSTFPWTAAAAAVPVVVVFLTARATQNWLRLFPELPESYTEPIGNIACVYQVIATLGLARWIYGIVPASDQVAAFLLLGTFVLSNSVRHMSSFGVRCSFILSAVGMWLYFDTVGTDAHDMATYMNAFAMFLFLCQPALLRHDGRDLVTPLESWSLILFSVVTGWLFVSAWVWTRFSPTDLTMGWAVYAFFLFLFGQIIYERRLRWCGLLVLVAALLRLALYDLWGLSGGVLVLTFLLLAIIALGVGFLLLRLGNRHTLL